MKYDKKHWKRASEFCQGVLREMKGSGTIATSQTGDVTSLSIGRSSNGDYRGRSAAVWASVWFNEALPYLTQQHGNSWETVAGLEKAEGLSLDPGGGGLRAYCEAYLDEIGFLPLVARCTKPLLGYTWAINGEAPCGWAPTEEEAWTRLYHSLRAGHKKRLREARKQMDTFAKLMKKGRRFYGLPTSLGGP